jgi:hypothetical protein
MTPSQNPSRYAAIYFTDAALHTLHFASLPEMATWAAFNKLLPIQTTPREFGCFRPLKLNGAALPHRQLVTLKALISEMPPQPLDVEACKCEKVRLLPL